MQRLFLVALVLAGCGRSTPPPPGGGTGAGTVPYAFWTGQLMGSSARIEVSGPDQGACDAAVIDALNEIQRIDVMVAEWKKDSPLSEINRQAGVRPVQVPPDLLAIVRKSIEISEMTGGAFDISFAAAGRLWNGRDPGWKVPSEEAVREALAGVGWKGIVVDEAASTVYLTRAGMRIGLGGIAPGYAADRAVEKIRARGIADAMVDFRGNLRVLGRRDGKPREVGIPRPGKPGEFVANLSLSDTALSTFGDPSFFFEKDGRRYGSIIDPRTGYPAEGCQSVTVLAADQAMGDSLAVGVFVMGPEKGLAMVESLEGVEAIIVGADGVVHVSKGLKGMLPAK